MRFQNFLKHSGEKIKEFLNLISEDRIPEGQISEVLIYRELPKKLWSGIERIFILSVWTVVVGGLNVRYEQTGNADVRILSDVLLFILIAGISITFIQFLFQLMMTLSIQFKSQLSSKSYSAMMIVVVFSTLYLWIYIV